MNKEKWEPSMKTSFKFLLKCLTTFFPEEFSFYPHTWLEEPEQFDEHSSCRQHKKKPTYVVKPDEGSQGSDIPSAESLKTRHACQSGLTNSYVAVITKNPSDEVEQVNS